MSDKGRATFNQTLEDVPGSTGFSASNDPTSVATVPPEPCLSIIIAVLDMLALSAHLPEVEFRPGDMVVEEGGIGGGVWVLVAGHLEVSKGGVPVTVISDPGALIGEISVLLGTLHGATVQATRPSRLRYASDGNALLSDPAVTKLVAAGLAERLNFVTTYLADLKFQYRDSPGLSMVSDVLTKLASRQVPTTRPGSTRDPDPDY